MRIQSSNSQVSLCKRIAIKYRSATCNINLFSIKFSLSVACHSRRMHGTLRQVCCNRYLIWSQGFEECLFPHLFVELALWIHNICLVCSMLTRKYVRIFPMADFDSINIVLSAFAFECESLLFASLYQWNQLLRISFKRLLQFWNFSQPLVQRCNYKRSSLLLTNHVVIIASLFTESNQP